MSPAELEAIRNAKRFMCASSNSPIGPNKSHGWMEQNPQGLYVEAPNLDKLLAYVAELERERDALRVDAEREHSETLELLATMRGRLEGEVFDLQALLKRVIADPGQFEDRWEGDCAAALLTAESKEQA